MPIPSAPPAPVSFAEALRLWLKIGLIGFGGPAGQIALMHRLVVEERRWVGEERFLHALNYCMLLPGPEAQQLATYLGWLLHRTAGGLAAGILFVLPGALFMGALSAIYVATHEMAVVQALFFGIKAAVLAVVIEALVRIGKRALRNRAMIGLMAAAFLALFLFDAPFPLVVAFAGLIGLVGARLKPDLFAPAKPSDQAKNKAAIDAKFEAGQLDWARPSLARAVRTLAVWLALWFIPLILLFIWLGQDHVLVQEGIFFSKMAVVTFGGAYAVLAYVAQEAVNGFGWLGPGAMLDGLGLAETTPGPLILVLQFVGFLAAFNHPGGLDPWLAGGLGAIVTLWATFTPCFLWIFLGAPYIEILRGNRALSGALAAITAAVAGVILNLAIWFALHVLFARLDPWQGYGLRLLIPDWSSLDPWALLLGAASALAMLRFKVNMLVVLGSAAALGLVIHALS
ncbi:MAG: chromate efflux transporter [Rhodospirillales bacterium]|nr:chromate efflux transporter [Rhodospirillales bacterium]